MSARRRAGRSRREADSKTPTGRTAGSAARVDRALIEALKKARAQQQECPKSETIDRLWAVARAEVGPGVERANVKAETDRIADGDQLRSTTSRKSAPPARRSATACAGASCCDRALSASARISASTGIRKVSFVPVLRPSARPAKLERPPYPRRRSARARSPRAGTRGRLMSLSRSAPAACR